MRRTRWLTTALVILLAIEACGGPAGSTSPGDSPAGSDPVASGRGALPTAAPVVGLAALAEHDEWLLADGLDISGASDVLGPGLVAWLDEQRAAFVDGIYNDNGIDAAAQVASLDGSPPATALGTGGWTMAMAGAFISSLTGQIGPSGGEPVGIDLTATETGETTRDGQRARASMTITLALQAAGSHIGGTIGLAITITLLGPDGTSIGSITITSTATVDMDVCPDIDGQVNAHFETDMEVSTTGGPGGAGSYRVHTTGTASGIVGDDAFLHALRVTGDSAMRASGTSRGDLDAAVSADGRYVLSRPGQITSLAGDSAENAFNGDVTRDNGRATDAEVTGLYTEVFGTGVIIAAMLFEAAQGRWRGGACVRIEATEQTREVDPDESISFTAKPVHVVEGIDLEYPIVATFNGVKRASPMGEEQEPPATIEFEAGPNPGDRGTITLKSTSKRGIGTLDVIFTVKRQVVIEVEVESSILVTKAAGFGANATATVNGRITLVQDPGTKLWSAMGSLRSVTTSGPVGCPGTTINGTGSYDWFVRELRATPGTTNVELWMDSGPIAEQPDTGIIDYCKFTGSTTINTWENAFFIAHNKDFGAKGFGISTWSTIGVPEIWQTGGLLVETTWIDACDGPSAAPGADQVITCSGKTTFRVWVVIPPPP